MAAPDMGACLSAGWNGLKNNFVTHVVACVLVGVVSGFTSGLLTGPMMVGYMRMVKLEEEGGRAQIGDVFKGFDDFVPALVAVLPAFLNALSGKSVRPSSAPWCWASSARWGGCCAASASC